MREELDLTRRYPHRGFISRLFTTARKVNEDKKALDAVNLTHNMFQTLTNMGIIKATNSKAKLPISNRLMAYSTEPVKELAQLSKAAAVSLAITERLNDTHMSNQTMKTFLDKEANIDVKKSSAKRRRSIIKKEYKVHKGKYSPWGDFSRARFAMLKGPASGVKTVPSDSHAINIVLLTELTQLKRRDLEDDKGNPSYSEIRSILSPALASKEGDYQFLGGSKLVDAIWAKDHL